MSIGGATYDVFIHLDADTIASCCGDNAFTFPLGAKIHSQKVTEACGGGASNTSVGLSRLGCDASFAGVVSDDQWGEKLLENLRKEGVDTRGVTIVEDEVSSFSIILTASDGERVILYDPGANEHLHDANFDKENVCSADWIYLNHIQEKSCVIQDDIVQIVTSECHPKLTWNPGGCQIDVGLEPENNRILLQKTTLLLVNKEEACAFTKQEDAIEALKIFLDAGAQNICITDGSRGVIASDGNKLYKSAIIELGTPIDTTGAGDAFGCGATYGLLQGKDLPTAIKMGSINASSVVCSLGAQAGLLTDTDMQSKMNQVEFHIEASDI